MNNKDLVKLEELLRESETKSNLICARINLALNEELKELIEKKLGHEVDLEDYVSMELNYGLRGVLDYFEEVKKNELAYLDSIRVYNYRVKNVLEQFER